MGRAVLTLLAAIAVAGCGRTTNPATPPSPTASTTASASASTTSASRIPRAQRTHELPTPAHRPRVAGGWRSPAQAVQYFAAYYINWTAQTVAAHLRALARVSVGQARAALSLQAAQTARDYELRRGGIANGGVVEAIAPLAGQVDRYAVVTRERTTASNSSAYQGLAPAWHVALATVTRVRGLWVLSAWQPEN